VDAAPALARGTRTVFGKPLGWTRGWTVVAVVWALAAGLLIGARIDVGHVTALSAREAAAIEAVDAKEVTPGLTSAEALQLVLRRYAATAAGDAGQVARPQWYALDRPWEDRVYVYWELGDYEPLAWTVDDDGTVTPDAGTMLLLRGVARAGGAP